MAIKSQPEVSPQAVMELIKTRRSIRRYKPDPIPPEYVEMIVEAAQWAPGGDNLQQPWMIVLIEDRETIVRCGIRGARGSGSHFLVDFLTGALDKRPEFRDLPPEKRDRVFHRLWSGGLSGFVGDCPLLIIPCFKIDEGVDNRAGNCAGLAAVTESMLLMIHALGLGGCWVAGGCRGIASQPEMRKLLNLPDDWYAAYFVPVGFPAETRRAVFRKPLSEIVCRNKFGEPYPFPSLKSGQVKEES